MRLLKELDPEEEKFYAEGAEEVEEEILALKKRNNCVAPVLTLTSKGEGFRILYCGIL